MKFKVLKKLLLGKTLHQPGDIVTLRLCETTRNLVRTEYLEPIEKQTEQPRINTDSHR